MACVRNPSTGVCRSPVYDSVEVDRAVVCLSSLGRGQFGRDTAWDGDSRAPGGVRRPVLGLRQLLKRRKTCECGAGKERKAWVGGKRRCCPSPTGQQPSSDRSVGRRARWRGVRCCGGERVVPLDERAPPCAGLVRVAPPRAASRAGKCPPHPKVRW